MWRRPARTWRRRPAVPGRRAPARSIRSSSAARASVPFALPLPELAPALFLDLDPIFLRRRLDALPGFVALLVGHPLDLVEAGDRVAHVAGVLQRLFALLREGEGAGGEIVAVLGVQSCHEVSSFLP